MLAPRGGLYHKAGKKVKDQRERMGMASGRLARFVETPIGGMVWRLAQLPWLRPLLRGLRHGTLDSLARLRPAHRRHDARQRAILAAFETATRQRGQRR